VARQKKGRPTAGSRTNVFYLVLGLVAVAGLGTLAYAVLRGGSTATAPVEVQGLDDPQTLIGLARGVSMGEADAPVKILEFGDYECGACATFASTVKPLIRNELVQSGRVQFIYYDFPLSNHRHSFLAARAARCAGDQDRYWEYQDVLFGQQSRWAFQSRPADSFLSYADQLGLDRSAFRSCLESDRHADVVTANFRLGEQLGVNATPTVIVNGRRVSNWSMAEIRRVVEQELGN
jgi:protein-disulfide isomerase